MCFSASASFGAGIVLSVIGVASIKKSQQPSQILFASIPLIFSIQQITEGFLWLALSNPAYASLQSLSTYIYLFFAQIIWPFWVPLAIFKLKNEEKENRKIQKILVGAGSVVSLYLGYCLIFYNIQAEIIGYHISYQQDYPPILAVSCVSLYIIATIAPPFFSSIKGMRILGIAMLISCAITAIFYEGYVVSVWCFFASVISGLVYLIIKNTKVVPVAPLTN